MKRILITGGGGTVGQILVRHYLEGGWHVLALDRSEESVSRLLNIKVFDEHAERKLFVEFMDILNYTELLNIVEKWKPEVVIHSAALKHVSTGSFFPEKL